MRCPRCGELIPETEAPQSTWARRFWLLAGFVLALVVLVSVAKETGASGRGLGEGLQEMLRVLTPSGRDKARTQRCAGHLRELVLATMIYRHDWDGCLPLAEDWLDAIAPENWGSDTLTCPSAPRQTPGYGYNAALSGQSADSFAQPWQVVLSYEARAGSPLAGGPAEVASPPRHRQGNNFAFLDGQVRQLVPGETPIWTKERSQESAAEERKFPPEPGLVPLIPPAR